MALAKLYGSSLDFIASKLGEVGSASVRNEREAMVIMLVRELPEDETGRVGKTADGPAPAKARDKLI